MRFMIPKCKPRGRPSQLPRANITWTRPEPAKPVRLIDLNPRQLQRLLEIKAELREYHRDNRDVRARENDRGRVGGPLPLE